MGSVDVDQLRSDGSTVRDVDTRLSEKQKVDLLLDSLPGARAEVYAGERAVRFQDQVIFKKQVTHLGFPWPEFKKRIQIPNKWVAAHQQAVADGLTPRFIGIYHYRDVTVLVDFDPTTYVARKANNSAAHVSTNDLHQAQLDGVFSRVDRNGNRLASVRADVLAEYLLGTFVERHPHVDVFAEFNREFLDAQRLEALDAVQEMHARKWPDTFQGEWAGFYLEFRLQEFLLRGGYDHLVRFQKVKTPGDFDYDLAFRYLDQVTYYGDLKASDIAQKVSPGNDAEDIRRCVQEFGRFWYVIYEHETWRARANGDAATIRWNEWRQSVGHRTRKPYDPLSYASRFKEAVRFTRMSVLEVNEANLSVVLGDFHQGRQQSGADRALKVMIQKKFVDNFLVFSDSAPDVSLLPVTS